MKTLTFIFNVEPKPKQSASFRTALRGSLSHLYGRVFTNILLKEIMSYMYPKSFQKAEILHYIENIAKMAEKQLPKDFKLIESIMHVNKLHYIYAIPKSFNKKQIEFIQNGGIIEKGTQPDVVDNLNKPVFDALQGVVYKNDGQITYVKELRKYYGIKSQIIIELEYEGDN